MKPMKSKTIMAYGSIMADSGTPYVGMASQKIAATLKVHKWIVCVRLVKGLHELYQACSTEKGGGRPGIIYHVSDADGREKIEKT